MRNILKIWIMISFISLSSYLHAQDGSGSRPALFKKAKVELQGSNESLIRMFSKHGLLLKSMALFSDRGFKANIEIPSLLDGLLYFELPFNKEYAIHCLEAGYVLVLAPTNQSVDRSKPLLDNGFTKIDSVPPFILFYDKPENTVSVFSKSLKKDEKLTLPAWSIVTGFEVNRLEPGGELLYNGIRLPKHWPPIVDWSINGPMNVPYLTHKPELININVGRQLFVDDFLIEKTDLKIEYHYPQKYEGNPILKPETDIEKKGLNNLALAGPKSGGLWWNEEKKLFELWYEAGWVTTLAYATSKDGLHWQRPNLSLNPGTNQILPSEIKPDSWTVVRDYNATKPNETYKVFLRGGAARDRARAFVTGNATDFGKMYEMGITGDRSTMFYNPFRQKWIYSLRWLSPEGKRSRAYWESDDYLKGMQWLPDEPYDWARADKLDPPYPGSEEDAQLYNLDAVAYESIMLGFFEILNGPNNEVLAAKGFPKSTGLNFAYSRDGFHWHRPDRKMAIDSENKPAWDRGYVQSLGNLLTVRGDKLWFYYIGFAGDEKVKLGDPGVKNSMYSGLYANGATGLAFLRRDGFISLNSDAGSSGLLLTRPVKFSGKYLFVNVDAPQGELIAEVVDMEGKTIAPFTFENCIGVKGNTTISKIGWKGESDLSILNDKPVRFRFKVKNGKFYSFWVSRDDTGRSDGYIGGGGPGFSTNVDNVGIKAYEAEKKMSPLYKDKIAQ